LRNNFNAPPICAIFMIVYRQSSREKYEPGPFDYHNVPLVGFSLGAGDVNTLASFGLGSRVSNHAISLPFGQIGAPSTNVTLGSRDPVNGGIFGLLTSPGATLESRGLTDHMNYCYSALTIWGRGGC
jgi:hypothetical protein